MKDYQNDFSIVTETNAPAKKPPERVNIQKAATLTLMGRGLSHADADKFVCHAIANLKNCKQDTLIAQEAYRLFQEHEIQEPMKAPLVSMQGYKDFSTIGLIDTALTMEVPHGYI